jgi:endonuclease/exonuclease/phosphatase family metal-dependent hydrolase
LTSIDMKALLLFVASFFAALAFGQKEDSLRIITYNIHHANPPLRPGTIDVNAVVSSLKKYGDDIIALQEVDVNTKRSGNVDEAKEIATELDMQFFFAKAINYDGGEYGVALLSRFELRDTQVLYLPMDTAKNGEQRVLATAIIRLPSRRSVMIACTHLDHRKDPKSRELQMTTIKAVAAKTKLAFVIAGDFNTEPGSTVLQSFDEAFQRSCEDCPLTFPADLPNKTIDFVGFKKSIKIKAISHAVLPETYASDHLPVRAVVLFN